MWPKHGTRGKSGGVKEGGGAKATRACEAMEKLQYQEHLMQEKEESDLQLGQLDSGRPTEELEESRAVWEIQATDHGDLKRVRGRSNVNIC